MGAVTGSDETQRSAYGNRPTSTTQGSRAAGVRFVLTGLSGTLVYAVTTLALVHFIDQRLLVNVLATVISTIQVNELHRRFTFRGARRPSWWRAQGAGCGMAAVGLLATSATLVAMHELSLDSGHCGTLLVMCCTQGAVGVANFIVLQRVLDWRRAL